MADGLQVGLLDRLAAESVVVLRGAIDVSHRAHLAATQSFIDVLLAKAVAGDDNAASPCLKGRYTLPIDVFGVEIADQIVHPLMMYIAGDRPFRKLIYGGVFVSYPVLSRDDDFHWHSDGHFDGLDEAGINFWIPLRDCGRQAAGMAFVRADEARLADLGALPQVIGTRHGHTGVNWPAVTDADIERSFGHVETPDFALGDVLVFTNAALHRTHFPTGAQHGRAAVIMRYTLIGCRAIAHAITVPTSPV